MKPLEVDARPPVRLLTLDTGPRNTLNLEAVRALRSALAFEPDAPVCVLRGRPDAFCAGLDNAVLAAGPSERESLLAEMGELLLEILTSPTRIVAAVEGHAVAAGAMLLLVADVRIGTTGSYKVGFTEQRIGMPLPELPVILARERLDRRRLHELTVLGRIVGPQDAVAAGFLDELVEPDAVERVAIERASDIALLSESAYAGSRDALWRSAIERCRELATQQNATRDRAHERPSE